MKLDRIKTACLSLSTGAIFFQGFIANANTEKTFANCYGEHHGSYLEFVSSAQNGEVNSVSIVVTGDNDEVPAQKYLIESMTKDSQLLQPKAYSWAIRQAIKAEAAGAWYGFILITAKDQNQSVMNINLQKYSDSLRHALAIDGYIEELTCPVEFIRD